MNLEYLKLEFLKGRDLIFDLDNTLIDETIYLFSAYKEIAIKLNNNEVYHFLSNNFKLNGRQNIYQKLISEFRIKDFELENFLDIIRNHNPKKKIKTLIWFQKFVEELNLNLPIYIISNGNVIQQKNKINNIQFPKRVFLKRIIYANQLQKKPDPISYRVLCESEIINNPIYIGDLDLDQEFAVNCNIEFINVKKFLDKY